MPADDRRGHGRGEGEHHTGDAGNQRVQAHPAEHRAREHSGHGQTEQQVQVQRHEHVARGGVERVEHDELQPFGTRGEHRPVHGARRAQVGAGAGRSEGVGGLDDREVLERVSRVEDRFIERPRTEREDRQDERRCSDEQKMKRSDPPIATVGLTEADAAQQGPVDVYLSDFRPMKTAFAGGTARSCIKLVVDGLNDRVLGVHMIGTDAPEIVQSLAVALTCGATKRDFDRTVAVHPTAAEEFVLMREPVRRHAKAPPAAD